MALTFVREDQNGDSASTEVWQLAAPDTGTNEVIVTISGNPDPVMAVAISFTGTNQTILVSNHSGNTGDSSSATVTVTSDADRIVADMIAVHESNTVVVGSGQILREDNSGKEPDIASSTESGASPDVTMSWTNVNHKWAMSVVDIDAAGTVAPRRVMVIT